jgi:hypothetical protein
MRPLYDSLSEVIPRKERSRLYLYRLVKYSPNIELMDHLLDFIEDSFGLLPRQSPSLQICFIPQFAAFVHATKIQGGLHVSLFGKSFRSAPVERAKFPNWRKYIVTHSKYLPVAEHLIREAHEHRERADENRGWTYKEELSKTTSFSL